MGYAPHRGHNPPAYALRVRSQRSSTASSIVFAALTVLMWAGAAATAAASAWSDHHVVAARLIAGAPGADGATRLGLHFRLAPEWHVYWKHPGDAGAPPQVSLAVGGAGGGAADGDRAPIQAEILFPAPQRFRLPGGLEALGYAGEVVYPLRLSRAAPAGSAITASLDYVACAVECIPYHDELAVSLPAATGPTATPDDELLRRWDARLPRPVDATGVEWRLQYRAGEAPEIELEVVSPEGAKATDPVRTAELFLEPAPGATFASPERIADARAVRFRAAVRPDVAGQAPDPLPVAWTLTGATAREVALAGVATVAAGGQAGTRGDASGVGDGSGVRNAAASRRSAVSGAHVPAAPIAALLALVALVAALVLWLIPERLPLPAIPPVWLRAAGFPAAASLVWFAYRLGALLPAARVGAVELSWLAAALAAQGAASASTAPRRRVWIALALLAAGAGAWAAWSPGMLSP